MDISFKELKRELQEPPAIMVRAVYKRIAIDLLSRGRFQPRQSFPEESLQELAESIRKAGIIQPIVVRSSSIGRYEIIAGERRWRAAKIAGLEDVPCLVGDYTNEEAIKIALLENTARENLNPLDEAEGIERMRTEFNYDQQAIAAIIGKSRSEVTNLLRLLKLDKSVKTLLRDQELTESHGKILAGLPVESQYCYARETIAKQWSTRELEAAIARDKKKSPHQAGSGQPLVDVDIQRLERKLSDQLNSPVQLKVNSKCKGYIKIPVDNLDILQGILERLGYQED